MFADGIIRKMHYHKKVTVEPILYDARMALLVIMQAQL